MPVTSSSRVGADLRAARERLGWTLPAIASHLRIRRPFLEAIEEGRIADLPGNAYAVGFLRSYAGALGLDPDEIARRFREEAGDVNRKTELTFPVPVPERGVPAGAVVLVGAVIAVLAYAGWYRLSADEHPASQIVQPVPEHLAPLAEKLTPPAAPAAPAAPSVPAATQPTALANAAPALPAVPPSSAAAAGVPPSTLYQPPAAAAPPGAASGPPAQQLASVAAPHVPAPDAAGRMILRAKADAWIQVRDRQGQVLLNRVLRNGESWSVPARADLLLTTGNAGGTEVLVDGVATAALGQDGFVRRDLPLDPDAAKDGKLAPTPKPVRRAAQ